MSQRKTEPLNTTIVSQASDLPFDSGAGEHILEDGTVYRFDGFVSSTNPIRLGTQTPLIGGHGSNDGFIRTSGGTAILGTDSGLFMRNIYCHAPNGTIFDVSGDVATEVLVESCNFSNDAGIAPISDLGTIDGMRVPTFLACSFGDFEAALKFRGNSSAPEKVFMDNCPVRRVATGGVTCLDFGGAQESEVVVISGGYFKEVQADTQIVNVQSGGSPSRVFQYRGNNHDSTVVQSNILNGEAGVTEVGYNVTDSAPLRDSTIVGEFSMQTRTETTINTSGTYEKVQGPGTLGNETERMQETATDGELEYLGRKRSNAKITVSASAAGVSNNDTYALAIAKNGSIQTNSVSEFDGQGSNKPFFAGTSSIEDLSTGDTLSVFVTNLDGTANVFFNSYNFNVVGV